LELGTPGKKPKPGSVPPKLDIELSNVEKANVVPEV
jgi:hypothetical protein